MSFLAKYLINLVELCYLWGVSNLLPDTDKLVGLHGEGLEPDVGRGNPDIRQLKL